MKVSSLPLAALATLLAAFALLPISGAAWAQDDKARERILAFESEVRINPDASLTVTERIRVEARGWSIRRGIFRDFPTRYRDRSGLRRRTTFEVQEVLRNGAPEPWFVTDHGTDKRLYMGAQEVMLEHGQHQYEITYVTRGQIGFFPEHDELYWNVTGHQWAFPIERANATVFLPPGAEALEIDVFTGALGEKRKDAEILDAGPAGIAFLARRRLEPGEGLTFAVSFPKGALPEPTRTERWGTLMRDNLHLLAAGLAFLGLLTYYGLSWWRVGRDPEGGAIIPRFEPPQGLSPAAVRFVRRMGYDGNALSAALLNMAVKGFLTIEEDGGLYRLRKAAGDKSVLAPGEKGIAEALLATRNTLALKRDNHRSIAKAIRALKTSLSSEFERRLFRRNLSYVVTGIAVTALAGLVIALAAPDRGTAGFSLLWLGIWTVGTGLLAVKIWRAWRAGPRRGFWDLIAPLFLTLFALPFFIGEVAGAAVLAVSIGVPAAALFLATVLLNPVFYELMKAPTRAGREILDEIEGFRDYLRVAEAPRLEELHPPKLTPELFERFLPYALALDVEHEWSERFAHELAAAALGPDPAPNYAPRWYHGESWRRRGTEGFASSLGASLSSSFVAAASPPGSSSGVGGGGFSGGGGGGGGGGGW